MLANKAASKHQLEQHSSNSPMQLVQSVIVVPVRQPFKEGLQYKNS